MAEKRQHTTHDAETRASDDPESDETSGRPDETETPSRRIVLKSVGAAVGAMGTLAGCMSGSDGNGSESGSSGTGGTSTTTGSESTDTTTSSSGSGGGSESVTINFLSGLAAENSDTKTYFAESMKRFGSQRGNVTVDLQTASYGDIKSKLSSTVSAGNAPELAESGSAGLQFYFDDDVADHGKYIEGTDLADNWAEVTRKSTRYRGEWWAGGSSRTGGFELGVRPKFFKQVGVDDPSQLATWTGFRNALEKIDDQFPDVHAYEETGVPSDLESYWNAAHTAWTDGKDPWFQGEEPWANPESTLMVGKDGRTDGMIKNTVDLASTYSSNDAATRGDEEIPALMMTDRVASFLYGLGNVPRWRAVKQDVTFGWDGDVTMLPPPKLDPDYGNEFGIDELAGHEGAHGGYAASLEQEKQVFKSDNEDLAWELNMYLNTDKGHVLPLLGEVYPSTPAYTPLVGPLQEEYSDSPSLITDGWETWEKYQGNYDDTGSTWDMENMDAIRWEALNQTISQTIAGQHSIDNVVDLVRRRILETAKNA